MDSSGANPSNGWDDSSPGYVCSRCGEWVPTPSLHLCLQPGQNYSWEPARPLDANQKLDRIIALLEQLIKETRQ